MDSALRDQPVLRRMTTMIANQAVTVVAVCLACALFGCSKDGARGSLEAPLTSVEGAALLRTAWTWSAPPDTALSIPAPQASRDVLLVQTSRIYRGGTEALALSAQSGTVLWRTPAARCALAGSSAVLLHDSALWCVDAKTGGQQWMKKLGPDWALSEADLAASDQVVVLATRAQAAAYEIATGRSLWHYSQPPRGYPADSVAMLAIGPKAAILSYRELAGGRHDSSTPSLVGIRIDDGQELWRYASPSAVIGKPWLQGDILLVRTDEQVVAVSAETGRELWACDTALPTRGGVAVVSAGQTAYSVSGRFITGYDMSSGSVRERCDLPEPLAMFGMLGSSVLVPVDGMLAIACLELKERVANGVFYLYSPEEEAVVYSSPVLAGATTSQVIAYGKRIFFVTMDRVVAMDVVGYEARRDSLSVSAGEWVISRG